MGVLCKVHLCGDTGTPRLEYAYALDCLYCMHVLPRHRAIVLRTDCTVALPAPMVRLLDSHVYALGYGLSPLGACNNNTSGTVLPNAVMLPNKPQRNQLWCFRKTIQHLCLASLAYLKMMQMPAGPALREREREIRYNFVSSHLRADQMCRGSFPGTHQ